MPFVDGVFANVAGASSAAAGQIIQSVVWNNIHTDYSTALNMLMGQMINTPSMRNIAWMNGGMEIWQRGAGATASIPVAAGVTTGQYTADRWYLATAADEASTVSAQPGLVDESQLCARVQRNSGQTGIGQMVFGYPLDTDEIYKLRGNLVNLSFRVRAGANWSPASGTLNFSLRCGTGAVGKYVNGFTNETAPINSAVNLTSSSVLVNAVANIIVPITATQAEIVFNWTPVGAAGVNDYFEVDDLQLEAQLSPSDWTPTSYDRLDFPNMLLGCKRHYQKTFKYDVAPAGGAGAENALTFVQGATLGGVFWIMAPELRVTPGINTYHIVTATASSWYNLTTSATYGRTIAATISDTKGIYIRTSATVAVDNFICIQAQASAGI